MSQIGPPCVAVCRLLAATTCGDPGNFGGRQHSPAEGLTLHAVLAQHNCIEKQQAIRDQVGDTHQEGRYRETALEPCVDAPVTSCNSSYLHAECTHATGPCVTLRFGVVSCLEGYCTLLRSHQGRHFWTRFTRVFGVSVLPLIDSLAGQFLRLVRRLTCPASRHETWRHAHHTLTTRSPHAHTRSKTTTQGRPSRLLRGTDSPASSIGTIVSDLP